MSPFVLEMTIRSEDLEKIMNDNLYDLSEEEFVIAGAYCKINLDPDYYDCDNNGCAARIARYFDKHPHPKLKLCDYLLVEV